jgi:beta-galactosidase
VLCLSHKTLGVGSNSCGPRPLEPYMVYAKPTTFSYQLQLSKKAPAASRGSVGALLKN